MDLPNIDRLYNMLFADEHQSTERASRKQEPEARARASVQPRTPAQPAMHCRNDLTRRSEETGEGREERKHSMMEHWRGAEKMQALVQRVKEAYAELQRQARALEAAASNGSQPIASAMGPGQTQAFNQDQSVETTIGDPAVPLTAESESNESHHQGPIAHPSMNSGQAPMGSDPVQLTPLQQAALTAIGHWLLVIGHCGSNKLTTGGSTKRTIGRSTQLITGDPKKMAQAGRLRSNAGSGGACLPIAA